MRHSLYNSKNLNFVVPASKFWESPSKGTWNNKDPFMYTGGRVHVALLSIQAFSFV